MVDLCRLKREKTADTVVDLCRLKREKTANTVVDLCRFQREGWSFTRGSLVAGRLMSQTVHLSSGVSSFLR